MLAYSTARNLGVIFDSDLSLTKHISATCKSCFYQIRQLRQIRPSLDKSSAITLANSLVSSKLDYCNSLYFGLPKSSLHRLQLVQNCLARAISPSVKKYDHISPVLRELHWLPISERITFKIATLTFKTINNRQPSYSLHSITNPPLICQVSSNNSRHQVRQRSSLFCFCCSNHLEFPSSSHSLNYKIIYIPYFIKNLSFSTIVFI